MALIRRRYCSKVDVMSRQLPKNFRNTVHIHKEEHGPTLRRMRSKEASPVRRPGYVSEQIPAFHMNNPNRSTRNTKQMNFVIELFCKCDHCSIRRQRPLVVGCNVFSINPCFLRTTTS